MPSPTASTLCLFSRQELPEMELTARRSCYITNAYYLDVYSSLIILELIRSHVCDCFVSKASLKSRLYALFSCPSLFPTAQSRPATLLCSESFLTSAWHGTSPPSLYCPFPRFLQSFPHVNMHPFLYPVFLVLPKPKHNPKAS